MPDGASLAADLIRLDHAGRVPVLLVRTPYSRAAHRSGHDVVGAARAGWAVVVVDVRGRYDSGGKFSPFFQEMADGYATVDWCANQPWSSGQVAMSGMSYLATAQWLAAASGHPALRAVNPVLGGSGDPRVWAYEGELFQIGLVASWVLGILGSDSTSSPEIRERAAALAEDWRNTLAAPAEADPVSELFPAYRHWRSRSTGSPTYPPMACTIPSFEVAGWFDPFCEQMLADHGRRAAHDPDTGQRLVIGPWAHDERLLSRYPELDLGLAGDGGVLGIQDRGVRWLAGALAGEAQHGGVDCYVTGSGEWRTFAAWPPSSSLRNLYFDECTAGEASFGRLPHFDGSLAPQARHEFGRVAYRHNPVEPVPTWGGRALGPYLPLPGPCDQRTILGRPDVLSFAGDPLCAPVTVIGQVAADLHVESEAATVDLHLKLTDIHPDGRVFNVTDSAARCQVHPVQLCRVPAGPAAHTFLPGHRIGAVVASSNFPRLELWSEPAGIKLGLGGRTPSRLLLPVV